MSETDDGRGVIDEHQISAEVALDDQPDWLRQFSGFVRVNRITTPGPLLVRCRACDLALLVPSAFVPSDNPQTILNLARHGMEHAAAGELPWLSQEARDAG